MKRILLRSSEHVEIRYSHDVPSPGDVLASRGKDWVVANVVAEDDVIACVLVLADREASVQEPRFPVLSTG